MCYTCLHFHSQLAGNSSKEFVMYTNENVDASVNSMVRHHFHLHHGDFVRVEVTATNKADSATRATSDGLKIDLTEPKMSQLVDGGDLTNDIQFTVIINVFCPEDQSLNQSIDRSIDRPAGQPASQPASQSINQ